MTHYIATVKIERVDEARNAKVDAYNRVLMPAKDRRVASVASFVINEDTLDNLVCKAISHLEIVSPVPERLVEK